jgi:3'-phosphoadenosine 5'-phosphosulfate sulfotransferase (PAPS reductase)/FAD synthetase
MSILEKPFNTEYLTPSLRKYLEPNVKMNKALEVYIRNQKNICSNNPQLTIFSIGLGQDSWTLTVLLALDKEFRKKYAPNDVLLVFANTNSEHPYTIDFRDRVFIPFCKEHGLNFVSIESDMGYHSENWISLEHQWSSGKPSIGSLAYGRFMNCTHNLKLTPQYRYVEEYLEKNYNIESGTRKKNYKNFAKKYSRIKWVIGISALEEDRVFNVEKETKQWHKESIDVVYPLIDLGMTRQDCQDFLRSKNLEIPFPSSCMHCPYASLGLELLFLYYTYPDDFYAWVEYEQKKLDAYAGETREVLEYDDSYEDEEGNTVYINQRWVEKPIKNVGVVGKLHTKGPKKGEPFTLLDALDEAFQKYPNITLDEINAYKFSHGHVGSVY